MSTKITVVCDKCGQEFGSHSGTSSLEINMIDFPVGSKDDTIYRSKSFDFCANCVGMWEKRLESIGVFLESYD